MTSAAEKNTVKKIVVLDTNVLLADPNSVLSELTSDLVASGVTVTFAAGNDGGNGSADETSSNTSSSASRSSTMPEMPLIE